MIGLKPLYGLNGDPVDWPDGLPVLESDIDRVGKPCRDHDGWRIKRIFFDGDLVEAIDFGPPSSLLD